jgi:general secretion pathway protein K
MKRHDPPSRGMALLAVLWMVAALGLLITGIVHSVRSEVKVSGSQRQVLIASARADAFILLALQNMQSKPVQPGANPQNLSVQFKGEGGTVSVLPLNGLIDINTASVKLLADMYRYAGGLSPQEAQNLAQATKETRDQKNSKGQQQNFDAIEDLLRVPTMTYDLYAKLQALVTADVRNGSGRINPHSAPLGVLQILTGGDLARATLLAAQGKANANTMDISFLEPGLIDAAPSSSLRLQTQVQLPDGDALQKTWFLYWGADLRSGLPWRVLGKQQSMLHMSQSGI